jgi:hypothetical protein
MILERMESLESASLRVGSNWTVPAKFAEKS